ncbi:ABC transporter substrate-binding protein [Thioalkalicoccus limnaeus]|uniref:ABC transporter substrate-binding protein n=1 Tax=Thioalkalicoccus limnaeus TaxID=120681 RepID=A0ABV4BH10_9GAMM
MHRIGLPALPPLVIALCWFLGAGALAAPEPIGATTLTIGIGRDFFNGPEGQVYVHGSTNTWEGLTRLDDRLTAQPWLAEAWHTPDDGRTWVFRLRTGVRFHDGSPLTAERAAETLNRLRAHPRFDPNGLFDDVESITAVGERDLVYRLTAPVPFFPKAVSYYGSPIVAPETLTADGRMEGLIGTGPFRLGRIRRGDSLEVLAFDDYWGGRPAYDRVLFRTILDADSRLLALRAGQIDAIVDFGGILPQQAPDLARVKGVTVKHRELANTHQVQFNCRRGPFAERAWREWFASRLDRAALVGVFAPGAGVLARDPHTRLDPDVAFGCIAPPPPMAPPGETRPADPLILLLHNGFAGRLPYLEFAQVIQQHLREAGLPTEIRIQEPGAHRRTRLAGDYDLLIGPTGFLTGDPDHHYANFVAGTAPFSGGCRDPDIEELIATARHETDPARRRDQYRRLCEWVATEWPMIPLYHEVALYAHRETVADLEMDVIFRPWLDRARPAAGR